MDECYSNAVSLPEQNVGISVTMWAEQSREFQNRIEHSGTY